MPDSTIETPTSRGISAHPVAPRFPVKLAAEAALRMLMNNLDPEVAERPADLVVYGAAARSARNWACYDAIVASLRALENDETLLVQSGNPWESSARTNTPRAC